MTLPDNQLTRRTRRKRGGATVAAALNRQTQARERQRRSRAAKAAAKASLAAATAAELLPSPLVPDQLAEPPIQSIETAGFKSLEDTTLDSETVDNMRNAVAKLKGRKFNDAQRALGTIFLPGAGVNFHPT